jgi:hypothetical protein
MFPAGAAGGGLLILRVCAAGMLARNSAGGGTTSLAFWEIALVIVLVGLFCLGACTPITCAVSAGLQIFMILHGPGAEAYQSAFSFCITSALFLLGPGAFSLDARLFGRRLIVHSNSR